VQAAPDASAAPAPSATEIVHRPEPGLRRGKWEAPAWAFWTAGGVIVLLAAAFVVLHFLLQKKKRV
jgi:hypothetical protein